MLTDYKNHIGVLLPGDKNESVQIASIGKPFCWKNKKIIMAFDQYR
jgi:hypothetical protein